MKPINYYINKFVRIFNSTCPEYSNKCYSWDNNYKGLYPCTDTRGWFIDGNRCQYFKTDKEQGLISRLSEKIMKSFMCIGGLE